MVALLNAEGGILVYGVRPNGIVYGERISRHEQDVLNNTIDNVVKRIIPSVGLDMYRVVFLPAIDRDRDADDKALQVLTIKVEPGNSLYEDLNHKVGDLQKGGTLLRLLISKLVI